MKLDRCGGVLAMLVTVFAMGCGTRASTKPVACPPPSATVSTTRLMSAELKSTDDAPKVGKSQHSSPEASQAIEKEEGAPHRRVDRRPGGGFSGYK